MIMKQQLLLLLFPILIVYTTHSQDIPNPEWHNYVEFHGRSITADPYRDGIVWIAGAGGLIRYDKHTDSWRSYTNAEGLSKIWASSVFAASDYIWVGTETGGANIFDPITERFTPFLQLRLRPHLPSFYRPSVLAIYPENEVVWVGTDNGIFLVDATTLDTLQWFTMDDGLGENYIYSIVNDGEYIWLATGFGGGFIWPPKTGGLSRINKSTYDIENFEFWEGSNWFRSIAADDSILWVAGGPQLLIFDKETEQFSVILEDVIYQPRIVLADDEDIWSIGRSQEGHDRLFRIDRENKTLIDTVSISGADIAVDDTKIFVTGQDRLYVSSKEILDFKLIDTESHFLPDRYCNAVSGYNEKLYAGCAGNLVSIDRRSGIYTEIKILKGFDGRIRGITVDGEKLWIATHKGLYEFDPGQSGATESYLSSIRVDFTVVDREYVWASSNSGLHRIEKATGEKMHRNLKSELNTFGTPSIRSIVPDGDVIWISFSGTVSGEGLITGIARLDRANLNTLDIKIKNIVSPAEIIYTLIDRGNTLLASGMQISEVIKSSLTIEPLIDQSAGLMRLSGSDLWISPPPNYRVKLFNIDTGEKELTIDESKGLLYNRITDIHLSEQYVTFSTTNGISSLRSTSRIWVGVPESVRLHQNYPNPFNASTNIVFSLPSPMHVKLNVYDILGRRVTTLVDQFMDNGIHIRTFHAAHLSSGVYFYRLEAGETMQVKRMVYVQ